MRGVGRIESRVGSQESGEIRKRKAAKGTKTGSNAKWKFAGSLKANTKGRKADSASLE
jgi:hypothetical protein